MDTMHHLRHALVAALLTLSLTGPLRAEGPGVESAIAHLRAHAESLETRIQGLVRLDTARLRTLDPQPATFVTFQTGWFGERHEYMSEVLAIRKFGAEILEAGKQLEVDAGTADFVAALHVTAPAAEHWRTAANASLVLDTLYNVELIPASEDISRHLELRRLFSELNFAYTQAFDLARPPVVQEEPPPAKFVSFMAGLAGKFPGERGRAIRRTLDLLGITRPTASIFAEHSAARMRDPAVRERIVELNRIMVDVLHGLQARRDGVIDLTLWDAALQVCSGDEGGALELLGVFTTQHRTLLQTVLPTIETAEERAAMVHPLILCASNFFLVQEINELTRTERGNLPFAYTPDRQSGNRRFYHFWSEAFVAHTLTSEGFQPGSVRFVTKNLGRAYETYTLPLNFRFALKIKSKLLPILKGWSEDVSAHIRGADFGIAVAGAE